MWNRLFFILIISATLLAQSCGDDEPDIASIKGTITVDNPEVWAAYVDSGEVQVTLFPDFSLDPPAGWGEVPDDFFGPGVPGGTFAVGAPYNSQNPVILEFEAGKTTYDYEIEVEPGTYSALAVGFRHDFISDPSLRTATVGVHWDNPAQVSHGVVIKINAGGMIIPILNFPAPSDIVVGVGEQETIDFRVDFDFLPQWYR